ncbi:hypothetical protein BH18ACI4_BH18ACI4_27240 [soil metagenome]
MPGLLRTFTEVLRLRGSSLFDRGYTIQFELEGLRRPTLISSAELLIKKDICYHPQPGKNRSLQSLDVFAPEPTSLNSRHPVVLFMHGGGWHASDKNDPMGVHANVCKAFRWTTENIHDYQGDPERVFLSGHSAGSHFAALLALDTTYLDAVGLAVAAIRGVVGICGVYNLSHFAGRNWMAEHLMTRVAFGNDDGVRAQASPVNHARADAPPFLLLNAQEDEKLEEEADELSSLLRSQGNSAETSIISGTNHFTILSLVGNGDDTLIDKMVEFVTRQSA